MNSVLKIIFFVCVVIFILSQSLFVIIWWEIGVIWSFLVFQSYFRDMSQPSNKVFCFNNNKSTRKICLKIQTTFQIYFMVRLRQKLRRKNHLRVHEWERYGYPHLFSRKWEKYSLTLGNLWKLVSHIWELCGFYRYLFEAHGMGIY